MNFPQLHQSYGFSYYETLLLSYQKFPKVTFQLIQQPLSRTRCSMKYLHYVSKSLSNET